MSQGLGLRDGLRDARSAAMSSWLICGHTQRDGREGAGRRERRVAWRRDSAYSPRGPWYTL